MGLDITSYGGLFRIEPSRTAQEMVNMFLEHGHWWKPGASLAWAEKEFPGRTAGEITTKGESLVVDAIYGFSSRYTFRAGSYSGYGDWRDWLATVGGWRNAEDCWEVGSLGDPFYELISFADNEGVIGSTVAAKLAKDFQNPIHERAALAEGGEWNLKMFHTWRRAFEIAADHGAVDFH
jgi:hypothetical protein